MVPSLQRQALSCKHRRESIACQKCIFPLAQGGERIEPPELRIHKTGVTHHHAAVRQPLEEARKESGEIGIFGKVISAGKGGIGPQTQGLGTTPKAAAQAVKEGLSPVYDATRPSKLAGCNRTCLNRHRICGSRCTCWCPSMNAGPCPNSSGKFLHLARNLICQPIAIEAATMRAVLSPPAEESALVHRPEIPAHWPERVLSAYVEPDGTRGAAELRASSAAASGRWQLAAATSAEVALRRPRTTRSRMAMLIAGDMP